MKDTNLTGRGMERGNSSIRMEDFMMDNGITTKCKAMAFYTTNPTTRHMRENG